MWGAHAVIIGDIQSLERFQVHPSGVSFDSSMCGQKANKQVRTMKKALLGGIVGTAMMTFMMYFVRPMLVGAPMDIAAEIGSQIGGNWWLGLAVHVLIGVVIVPVLLLTFLSKFLPGPSIVQGLLTGIGFWVVSMTILMPMMGKGLFLTATGEGPKAIMAAFMAHAVYGLLLGMIGSFRPAANAEC